MQSSSIAVPEGPCSLRTRSCRFEKGRLVRQLQLAPWPLLLSSAKLGQKVQAWVDWDCNEVHGALLQTGFAFAGNPLLMQSLQERQVRLNSMPVLQQYKRMRAMLSLTLGGENIAVNPQSTGKHKHHSFCNQHA